MGTQTHSDESLGFENLRSTVPVGRKYERYDGDMGTVEVGDIVVWEDPDAGMHVGECELISSSEYIAKVTDVYAFDADYTEGVEVEIGVSAPFGRLPLSDVYVCGRDDPSDWRASRADMLLSSEYDEWVNYEYHMDEYDVPTDLWERYDEPSSNSGPRCEYCNNGGEPRVTGE